LKKIALTIIAMLLFANTAHAQKRVKRRYVQRPDYYAQAFNDWASGLQADYSGINTCARIGGSGMSVGTNLTCYDCGTEGHYSCGAVASTCPTNYLYQALVP
jgi:hypothetical protein